MVVLVVVLVVKSLPASAEDIRVAGSNPGFGRSPGEGLGHPLQYSCLENPKDRGAWWAILHRVTKSLTRLKRLSTHACNWLFQNQTNYVSHVLSSFQSLSHVQLFATPWTAAHQASLSSTNSQSLPKLMSIGRWWHPTISSSVIPFSSRLQSFPASGSFQMSQLFTSGGQSVEVSASASVLPMNTQDWSPLGWTGWISLQSKGLPRVFSNTTVQKHQLFGTQLSSQSNSHIHPWPLEKPWPWLDGPLLAQ